MSKFVKNIITEELKKRLGGVENALLVNLVGMQVNDSNKLRAVLAEKDVRVMVSPDIALSAGALPISFISPM